MARGICQNARGKKMNGQNSKTDLRQKIRAALKNLPPEKRAADSIQLCAKLKEQFFFQSASTILFFAPLPDEIDLWPLLEESLAEKKVAALPHFDSESKNYVARRVKNLSEEIFTGNFRAREPHSTCAEIPLTKIDLIFVPGVAFDLRGNRLGRGKGFYDRLLEKFRGVKCGVGFDEQIISGIPVEAHDARLDFILTPTNCAAVKKI
jgi:5-formyltetrahydrofolate cyclo-ligase